MTWTVINEIYPGEVRGRAVAVATAVNWGAAFLVSEFFLTVVNAIGQAYTFWLFAAFCALGLIWVYVGVPETRAPLAGGDPGVLGLGLVGEIALLVALDQRFRQTKVMNIDRRHLGLADKTAAFGHRQMRIKAKVAFAMLDHGARVRFARVHADRFRKAAV